MKVLNIIIIGYYDHNNIGDEQYKTTFMSMMKEHLKCPSVKRFNIKFIDSDLLKSTVILDSDIIILGGGDVLNNYFLDEINEKFKGKPNKILAVSVGLPYEDILINTEKLALIDYIFLRTEQDIELFGKYYRKERLFYLPDISYFLLNQELKAKSEIYKKLVSINKSGTKILALCLNRHIYSEKMSDCYKSIISELAVTVNQLLRQKYFVVFLPFNTNNDNAENDILIHDDVYNEIDEKLRRNVMNITSRLSVSDTFDLFEQFSVVLPMRFHACLFSIYHRVPMVPILTTKKVSNIILDIDWKHSYKLSTDENDIPLTLDSAILLSKIKRVSNPEEKSLCNVGKYAWPPQDLKKYLSSVCDGFKEKMVEPVEMLFKILDEEEFEKDTVCINRNEVIVKTIVEQIKGLLNISLDEYLDLSLVIDDDIREEIIGIVSYNLTNNYDSEYNYGLSLKMFRVGYNYTEEWMWILCEHSKRKMVLHNNDGIFNMNYVDQIDYSGSHRSGWRYVIDYLKRMNNNSSNLLIDLSVDKTFHWREKIGKRVGIIPYRKKWIGFIHHTFDKSFSEHNNVELLKKESFRESLKYCKGLIVFSNHVKSRLDDELEKMGFDVKTFVLCHPTEIEVKTFSYSKFIENKDKKIVNIGGWMRNIFSFYNLFLPKYYSFIIQKKGLLTKLSSVKQEYHTMRKVALKGRNMNNYFPLKNDVLSREMAYYGSEDIISKSCSENKISLTNNNWYKHYNEYMRRICHSVEVMEHLCDEDYDELLSENIVFLNLVDASAVNTIIECIVRCTPIIVNRLPAVVEFLGEMYPLYYGDAKGETGDVHLMNEQISTLLSDTKNIKAANKYLAGMNKNRFTTEYFREELSEIVSRII